MPAPDGLLIIDKPPGWTSHDVVGRCRRLAQTRRVGHAGTLDPMATGVLVIGVGRATRLLGHLARSTKGYDATIRLGQSTLSDDADGETVESADASGLTDRQIRAAVRGFVGDLQQVPSAVSAIKVQGRRAYARVRAGEAVVLAPRPVHVASFAIEAVRRAGDVGEFVDLDVQVECSAGTYVRALARDLGAALGVGGHLTALRRTRVDRWTAGDALTLDSLTSYSPQALPVVGLDEAARQHFAWYVVDGGDLAAVRNGRPIEARLRHLPGEEPSEPQRSYEAGERGAGIAGPVAVLAPGGKFLALYEQDGQVAKAVAVFTPA